MYYIILACAGGIIALAGIAYLAGLLYLKMFGIEAEAEVIEAKEKFNLKGRSTGSYVHKMRYSVDGKSYEVEDRAGYSKPLAKGSVHTILCAPKNPKKFKFEADVQSHITIAAVFIAMALIFAGRFIYAYMK